MNKVTLPVMFLLALPAVGAFGLTTQSSVGAVKHVFLPAGMAMSTAQLQLGANGLGSGAGALLCRAPSLVKSFLAKSGGEQWTNDFLIGLGLRAHRWALEPVLASPVVFAKDDTVSIQMRLLDPGVPAMGIEITATNNQGTRRFSVHPAHGGIFDRLSTIMANHVNGLTTSDADWAVLFNQTRKN